MPLRITNLRHVTALSDLVEHERAQLAAAGKEWDGCDLPAAERLTDDEDAEFDEGGPLYKPELCDVIDDAGAVVYQLWTYCVDSGSLFRAGTTESVGGFIQNYLEVEDPALYREIALALKAAKEDGLTCGATGMAYKLAD